MDRNCLAYADKDSTYLLCPSAYRVSNAKLDFPDPDNPVMTTSLSLGISISIFLRLCCLAPLTLMSLIKKNNVLELMFRKVIIIGVSNIN